MKNSITLTLCAALFLMVAILGTAQATDQPLADKVVGYWVSSSGTPLTISYSGDPQKVWLSINGGANIDVWLAGGRDGGTSLDYQSADGSKIHGTLNGNGTISVSNDSGSFNALWRRR
jgi:hypothetical protein